MLPRWWLRPYPVVVRYSAVFTNPSIHIITGQCQTAPIANAPRNLLNLGERTRIVQTIY